MTREEAIDYIREWCPYDKHEEIINALEQEPKTDILDKIMVEIEQNAHLIVHELNDYGLTLNDFLQIINKYKMESDDKIMIRLYLLFDDKKEVKYYETLEEAQHYGLMTMARFMYRVKVFIVIDGYK